MLAAAGHPGQSPRRNFPLAVAGRFGAAAEEEVGRLTPALQGSGQAGQSAVGDRPPAGVARSIAERLSTTTLAGANSVMTR